MHARAHAHALMTTSPASSWMHSSVFMKRPPPGVCVFGACARAHPSARTERRRRRRWLATAAAPQHACLTRTPSQVAINATQRQARLHSAATAHRRRDGNAMTHDAPSASLRTTRGTSASRSADGRAGAASWLPIFGVCVCALTAAAAAAAQREDSGASVVVDSARRPFARAGEVSARGRAEVRSTERVASCPESSRPAVRGAARKPHVSRWRRRIRVPQTHASLVRFRVARARGTRTTSHPPPIPSRVSYLTRGDWRCRVP